jgi:hypothetical protein
MAVSSSVIDWPWETGGVNDAASVLVAMDEVVTGAFCGSECGVAYWTLVCPYAGVESMRKLVDVLLTVNLV